MYNSASSEPKKLSMKTVQKLSQQNQPDFRRYPTVCLNHRWSLQF